MPSSALVAISDEIEKQQTDSLGKFYMYAALLHSITVRDEKKKFDDLLPEDRRVTSKGMSFLGRKIALNTGAPSVTFYESINKYRKQFDHQHSEFDVFAVAKKLVLAYFRQGQLGDLAFINKRMLSHLDMLPKSLNQNDSIYKTTKFVEMQEDIRKLLKAAQAVHENGFACVDNGLKTIVSIAVAMLGLIAVVSMTHVFVGLAMMAAGGVGAYAFFKQLERSFMQMRGLIQACTNTARQLYIEAQGLKTGESGILARGLEMATEDPLRISFLVESIIMPLDYSSVTISEQLGLSFEKTERDRGKVVTKEVSVEEMRADLDRRYQVSRPGM